MIKPVKFVVAFVATVSSIFASSPAVMTDEELGNKFLELDWNGVGSYELADSHSTLALPADHLVVLGKDAERFNVLCGNPRENKELEAIVIDEDFSTVYFESHNEGYVSLDDWKEIDPKKFLDAVIENTEEANKERRRQGISEIHVTGWVQEPTLDKQTNTAYWAIEAVDDDACIVNSVAIRLGRKGFERIVWVADRDSYVPFGGELDVMLRAHSFDPGYRYSDFVSGDKVATYGIAGLVAATIGAKALKATGLLVLFKKCGAFIFAGISALLYKIRKKLKFLFSKKN